MRRKYTVLLLLLVFTMMIFAGTVQAESAPDTFPDVLTGDINDQNGQAIAKGTIRAYIGDKLVGEMDFTNGRYEYLTLSGSSSDIGKPVVFKLVINEVEILATYTEGTYNFQSGKLSGSQGTTKLPYINLTVDLTQIPDLKAPTASPAPGANVFPVTVTLACETSGAKVYYTIDGSDPKTSSTKKEYATSFTLQNPATIKAVSARGSEFSSVKSFDYTMPQITISGAPTSVVLKPNETKQLTLTTTPADATLKYESSKTNIVTVDSSGKITAKAKGTAEITVTATKTGMTAVDVKIPVTISENPIVASVTPETVNIKVGETKQLSVTTTPTGATIGYSSNKTGVATVTSNGLVTATGVGTAVITITISKDGYDTVTDSVPVTVSLASSVTPGGSGGGGTITPVNINFSDISGHWAKAYIEELAQKGIISGPGDGTFRPENNITRAEFAKILSKAMNLSEVKPATPTYSDVAASEWYYGFVEAAAQAGYIKGDGVNFRPNDLITREEVTIILVRALGKQSAAEASAAQKTAFGDDASIDNWARGHVITAVQNQLVGGSPDNNFYPLNNATRAEACKMISVFMTKK